jgi:hypothetical protein
MFIGAVGFNENSTSASGTTYLRILRQSVNYVCHNPNLPLAISHGNIKYVCQALASWDSGRREVAKCPLLSMAQASVLHLAQFLHTPCPPRSTFVGNILYKSNTWFRAPIYVRKLVWSPHFSFQPSSVQWNWSPKNSRLGYFMDNSINEAAIISELLHRGNWNATIVSIILILFFSTRRHFYWHITKKKNWNVGQAQIRFISSWLFLILSVVGLFAQAAMPNMYGMGW